jgi:Tfp pilus assembly protein FimT
VRNSKGFTIIELVIVLTIVIILSVVAIVAITNQIKSIKLNNASDKMVSDLIYAQYMANGTGQWYGVSLEANPTNIYSVYTTNGTVDTIVTDPSNKTASYQVQLSTNFGIQISAVTIEGGGKHIEFRPDGVPFTDKYGHATSQESVITLTNGTGNITVRITPNTGRIYDQ